MGNWRRGGGEWEGRRGEERVEREKGRVVFRGVGEG